MQPRRVNFHTLGCKLNFSESSTLAREFERGGFVRVAPTAEADICVINSCSVTELGLYGFTAIQQSLNSAEQTKTSAQNALTSAQNAVETAQNQIETCESQQKSAHDSYDQEKNYSTIKAKAQSVEDAKTKLEQAKRTPDTLTTLKDTLANCTLTATMSGTITALDATVGSICTGTVATIQNTDALVVEVTTPSNDVPGLTTGMRCNITSDATGDDVIAGTLTQIDPVANDSGTFGAKVRVNGDADDLLIGIQAKVEIVKNATDGVFTVPIDAVGTKEDGPVCAAQNRRRRHRYDL